MSAMPGATPRQDTPPAAATPSAGPLANSRRPVPASALRAALEVGVVVFVFVMLFRFFLAEAYVVPTGSMAPALLGFHKSGHCPRCGFPVTVGHLGQGGEEADAEEQREVQWNYSHAACPNCGYDALGLDKSAECTGDRLLVHK